MEAGPSETRVSSSPSHPLDPGGFAPGHVLADRYRIVAPVGRGGMGEVYRADDLKLGQPVALKFLPADLERDPAARDRLLAEVRSARTVSHPNVCRVYDVGDIDGRVFLTMEYIDGEDLASLLRRIGRLPVAKALEVARQLCAGLAAAHDKGLLHRDLKPANVMIDGRGQARITDFGLAVSAGAAATPADFAGTLAYMAPERFRGMPATVQSDLYGLGLILYETYTGKSPFKAGSVQEWERAHTDSTPSSPSALASEIEPAVDRAILRCLEKDPTKRPASAAQVAAALPGGDPLAAALAAGETPSPELVAASGEEGTLPRAKAWLWLAACLIALAVVPFTMMPFSLAEHVALDLSPDALQTKAREVLQQLGYPDKPADRAWWFRIDDEYLERVNRLRPREAADELRNAVPGPVRFCYRQSPRPMVPMGVFRLFGISILGQVTATDPPPEAEDVYLELAPDGRLVALQVTPPVYGKPQPSTTVDWATLFDGAKLGPPDSFVAVVPQWWPTSAVDVREAREGIYHGQKVRVEAGARAGRSVFFRVIPPWTAQPPPPGTVSGRAQLLRNALLTSTELLGWGSLVVMAVLARRNLRLARGDRTGARRLAISAIVAQTLSAVLIAHTPLGGAVGGLPHGLFFGLLAWLLYLGFEPAMRRAWPQLLIASTRLLDGRWRDPLVGRAVLAGILVGLAVALPWSLMLPRLQDLSGGGPTDVPWILGAGGFAKFLGELLNSFAWTLEVTLVVVGILLVVRLLARRTDVTVLIVVALFVGWNYLIVLGGRPATISAWLLLVPVVLYSALFVWVFWRHGALAFFVSWFVTSLAGYAPWTLEMSRWYAWRQWFIVAAIVALAVWGFRNVLGRQSAFPTGALDG